MITTTFLKDDLHDALHPFSMEYHFDKSPTYLDPTIQRIISHSWMNWRIAEYPSVWKFEVDNDTFVATAFVYSNIKKENN